MSISVFSVDKLLNPMDYTATAMDTAMHSESDTEDTKDSKCSSPVNSNNSESLDVRNSSVSNLSQDILQTMIQSCRRLAANSELTRCGCGDQPSPPHSDQDRKAGGVGKCEKCGAAKFNLNLRINDSDSFKKDKCNTIIEEPVKPVLKFSVSAILSDTKSCTDERLLKTRHGKTRRKLILFFTHHILVGQMAQRRRI